MTTVTGSFRGNKRIDPRPRKQKSKPKKSGPTWPKVLQLNIEGLTANKMSILGQLATRYKAFVILLQETHCTSADRLVSLADVVPSRKHGLATFVHDKLGWALVDQSPTGSAIEWLRVDVNGIKIVNVYKLSSIQLTPTSISVFQHPFFHAGDFNCQRTTWGYKSNSPDEEWLVDWAAQSNLALLYNPKDASSFFSACWSTGTNQILPLQALGIIACIFTDVS